MQFLFEDFSFIDYKLAGVGKGKTKSGRKKTWKKNSYFDLDLLKIFQLQLTEKQFKKRFAGFSSNDLEWFF